MATDPTAARAISWDTLITGRWDPAFTDRPCSGLGEGNRGYGLLAVGRHWRKWRTGSPPTWAEFVDAEEIAADDRRWLIARALLCDRRRLVAWVVDCAEAVIHLTHTSEVSIRLKVIVPLRAWIAGDAVSLSAVRQRASQIVAAIGANRTAAATAAVYAAVYAADAAVIAGYANGYIWPPYGAADAADAAAAAAAYASAAIRANAAVDGAACVTVPLRLAIPHLAEARR
jgi:hypothetical protein